MFRIIFIFNVSVFLLCSLVLNAQEKQKGLKLIVIDPGHGGHLPGAVSRFTRKKEKDIVLKVSLMLRNELEKRLPETEIYMTRETDKHVDFLDRVKVANNEKADLFLSIHCNASRNSKAYGSEIFVAGSHRLNEQDAAMRENLEILQEENFKEKYKGYDPTKPETQILLSLSKNLYREQSLNYANILDSLFKKAGRKSRGVKEQGLIILQTCARPGVLIELGFISNYSEGKFLTNEAGQKKMVEAIVESLLIYNKQISSN